MEAKPTAKAKAKRDGVRRDSKAIATIAESPNIVQNGARRRAREERMGK